jgi:chaperone protein PapD
VKKLPKILNCSVQAAPGSFVMTTLNVSLTLFYFNVREIPPKTDKKNVMQVTMQHALKLFWRPKAIELEDDGVMSYEKVEIIRRNDGSIRFNNKMPYHVTLGYH